MKKSMVIVALVVSVLGCRTTQPRSAPQVQANPTSSGNEHVKAIEDATRVIKADPDGPEVPAARLRQAEALFNLGILNGAITVLDEITGVHHKSDVVPNAWLLKGDCCYILGREDSQQYQHAMVCYRAVVKNADAKPDLIQKAEQGIKRCEGKLGKDMPNQRIESDFDTRAGGAATEAPHP